MTTLYVVVPPPVYEYIKIGFVHGGLPDVWTRLQSLQTGNPNRLDILFTTHSPYIGDGWLKHELRFYQHWREWYYPDAIFYPTMRKLIHDEFAKRPRGRREERIFLWGVKRNAKFYLADT